MEALKHLINVLTMEQVDDNVFRGEPIDLGFPRLFGGHVLAQSLYAAAKTVSGRRVHSLHSYFLRPGNTQEEIFFEVDLLRDGRSFNTRRVIARQRGKVLFSLAASFQTPEEGFEHHFTRPYAPPPDDIESDLERTRSFADKIPENIREKITGDHAIEMRTVDPGNPFQPHIKQPENQVWLRAAGEVAPDDPLIHTCLLAYSSDFSLLGTSLRPHGASVVQPQMQCASLDHAMWFHHDVRMDDWLLYTMDSPSAAGGRGFNRGSFYDSRGLLVASVAQEGLIRRR